MKQEDLEFLKESMRDVLKEIDGKEREIIGLHFMLGLNTETLRPRIRTRAGVVKEGFKIVADMAGLDAEKAEAEIREILEQASIDINQILMSGAGAYAEAVAHTPRSKRVVEKLNKIDGEMHTKH